MYYKDKRYVMKRTQLQKFKYILFHLYEIPSIGESIETEVGQYLAGAGEEVWGSERTKGVSPNGYRVSSGEDKIF